MCLCPLASCSVARVIHVLQKIFLLAVGLECAISIMALTGVPSLVMWHLANSQTKSKGLSCVYFSTTCDILYHSTPNSVYL